MPPRPVVRIASTSNNYSRVAELAEYHATKKSDFVAAGDAGTSQCCGIESVFVPLLHSEPMPSNLFPGRAYPLSANMFQRSLVSIGSLRLQGVALKLINGQNLTIVTIGGSVAAGKTVIHKRSTTPSTARFVSWLAARYRHTCHDCIFFRNLALPGSTSEWRSVEIEQIAALKPDLVLWDYSANDLLSFSDVSSLHRMRATLERLARGLVLLPSKPAVVYLAGMRNFSARESATYHVQAEAVEPVCKRYGVAVVSYRDAIWPNASDTSLNASHLYDTYPTAWWHPTPWTHQLIADTLCYFWVIIDELARRGLASNWTRDGSESEAMEDFSPAFLRATDDVLSPCEGGWKTVLRFHRVSSDEALDVSRHIHGRSVGWNFTSERSMKEGWEFDARSYLPDQTSSVAAAAAARSGGMQARLLEPISFRMRFSNEKPRLVVTHMRSYSNFGRALVWIDDEEPGALHRVHVNDCYIAQCTRWFGSQAVKRNLTHPTSSWCGDDPHRIHLGGNLSRERCASVGGCRRKLELSSCHRSLAGQQPPFVLDGWWSDRSSQTHSEGFDRGFTPRIDLGAEGLVYFVENSSAPLIGTETRKTAAAAAPSRGEGTSEHVVRIAMLAEPGVIAGTQGAQAQDRARFKVMALRSC